MIEYFKKTLTAQFEAALCMLDHGIRICPSEHWDGTLSTDTFRSVAYHTLFYVDYYLSPSEEAFALRELHQRGGDERLPVASVGLLQNETIVYAEICRQKMLATLAAETRETLEAPCGFKYRLISRGELHLVNVRHIQHHAGQMSAYLRKVADKGVPWNGAGWR